MVDAELDLLIVVTGAVALDLPGGTLIYAADEGVSAAEHIVVHADKRLHVVALDLLAPRAGALQQIASIALHIERSARQMGLAPRLGTNP